MEVSEKVTTEILKSLRKLISLFPTSPPSPSSSSSSSLSVSPLLPTLSCVSPLLSPLLSQSHISVQEQALYLTASLFRSHILSDSQSISSENDLLKTFLDLIDTLSAAHQTVDARLAAAKAISFSGFLPIVPGHRSGLLVAFIAIRLLSDDDEDVRKVMSLSLSQSIPIKVKGTSGSKGFSSVRQPVVSSLILDSLWSHIVDTSESDPSLLEYLENTLFRPGLILLRVILSYLYFIFKITLLKINDCDRRNGKFCDDNGLVGLSESFRCGRGQSVGGLPFESTIRSTVLPAGIFLFYPEL